MVMVAGGGDRKKGNLRTNHCFPEAPSRGWRGPEAEELALLAWGGRNFSCPPQQHPEHAWTSSGCFHCFVLLSKAQWDGVGPGQPLMETPSHTSAFCGEKEPLVGGGRGVRWWPNRGRKASRRDWEGGKGPKKDLLVPEDLTPRRDSREKKLPSSYSSSHCLEGMRSCESISQSGKMRTRQREMTNPGLREKGLESG